MPRPLTHGTNAGSRQRRDDLRQHLAACRPQVEAKGTTQMLGLKLVRLIERHSEELALGLTQQVRDSERTSDFKKIPRDELRLAAVEVYRNLEEWLLQKKEDDIGKRFRTIAARRASQGVRLCQLVWVLVISRNHLWHFLQQESFVDNIFELFGELEVQQMLNQFFDRAIYYSILGYEEEVRQDDADRTEQEGRFIAGTPGST